MYIYVIKIKLMFKIKLNLYLHKFKYKICMAKGKVGWGMEGKGGEMGTSAMGSTIKIKKKYFLSNTFGKCS